MPNIYEQHRAAFRDVSAYVITDKKGKRVATLAFKYPKDGAGRLYCYLHIIGIPMVRDFAGGYGYDKRSAAVQAAIAKAGAIASCDENAIKVWTKLKNASPKMESGAWDFEIMQAGYNVLNAI